MLAMVLSAYMARREHTHGRYNTGGKGRELGRTARRTLPEENAEGACLPCRGKMAHITAHRTKFAAYRGASRRLDETGRHAHAIRALPEFREIIRSRSLLLASRRATALRVPRVWRCLGRHIRLCACHPRYRVGGAATPPPAALRA